MESDVFMYLFIYLSHVLHFGIAKSLKPRSRLDCSGVPQLCVQDQDRTNFK